jgi:hypothetical protein
LNSIAATLKTEGYAASSAALFLCGLDGGLASLPELHLGLRLGGMDKSRFAI